MPKPSDSKTGGKATVLLGSQWGDEGKGKLADVSQRTDGTFCARCAGGNNAGHTIVADVNGVKTKFDFHLLPSGLVNPRCAGFIGSGVVVHVPSFFAELDTIEKKVSTAMVASSSRTELTLSLTSTRSSTVSKRSSLAEAASAPPRRVLVRLTPPRLPDQVSVFTTSTTPSSSPPSSASSSRAASSVTVTLSTTPRRDRSLPCLCRTPATTQSLTVLPSSTPHSLKTARCSSKVPTLSSSTSTLVPTLLSPVRLLRSVVS